MTSTIGFSEVKDRKIFSVSLKTLLVAVLTLNLFDACATLLWVNGGLATEANPVMADLLYTSPHLFVLTKMSLAAFGCLLLWRLRTNPAVHFVSECLVLVYGALGVYHLQGFMMLLV